MLSTSFPNAEQAKLSMSRVIGQLGFTPPWKITKNGYLRIRVSAPSTSEGGLGGLQDGAPSSIDDDEQVKKAPIDSVPDGSEGGFGVFPNANGSSGSVVEENKKNNRGLVFNTETDSSGSIVGFKLVPPSGMFLNSSTMNCDVVTLLFSSLHHSVLDFKFWRCLFCLFFFGVCMDFDASYILFDHNFILTFF